MPKFSISMRRRTNLRELIGMIKDKVSQSKAAITNKPKNLSLHLALLKATTHDSFTPPNPKHITTLLSFGHGSRATAAAVIDALMDRLHSTHDCSVAIKCLIAVHHIIKQGSFILQDQLSVYPSTGGRNYLKLSNFRDNTSPMTWELSSWVRWYARYLEHLLSTSRILGYFLCSTSSTSEKEKEEDKVSALMNSDLLKQFDSLVELMEELCKRPDSVHLQDNDLVGEITNLVVEDYSSATSDIWARVNELTQRRSCLSFGDSVELVCVLKRLEDCRERLLVFSNRKIEDLWCLLSELKDKVGMGKAVRGGEGRTSLVLTWERGDKGSESARFCDRAVSCSDSLRFSSARFGLNIRRRDFSIIRQG